MSGDNGGTIQLTGGIGEAWYKVRVTEDSDWWYDLALTVTLDVAAGTDYDLYVYRDGYGSCTTGDARVYSANGTSLSESVSDSWSDSWGSDNDRDFYIWVRFYNANTCGAWSLTLQGRS